MLIAAIVLWIICGYLCCKVDSILCNQETWSGNLVMAMFVWPFVFVMILFTKHYVGAESTAGRIEGHLSDKWRY